MLQQLINGLSIGSIYALMAVGYSLVYSLLNFTNFAHGVVVTVGAYLGFYSLSFLSPKLSVAIFVSIFGCGLFSVFYEMVTYRPLLIKGTKRLYLMIAALGISILVENLIIVVIGGRFKAYQGVGATETMSIFGVNIGVVDFQILIISILALIFVQFIIEHTKAGLAIRGAAFNFDITSLMGVNTEFLITLVFMLAGALAGLAGIFLGIKYTAYPQLGALTTKAFISAVFGGLGSLPGAVIGAYILGISETLISGFISSSLRDIFSFLLLVVVLLVRPSGLMGKNIEDKA